ncbi:NAD(P)/FAD-dependent oxidoreductase [Streptomyces sp. NL15-2K]|uniref:FAD-dependent oxidoreductase n=1 Tax=Streptomyces sp. NL15-2K TaxID=376149 RepID=UPI000F56E5A3|nr:MULTISPECIES: hypothetical protein [Actinomycetes]WKX15721.1 hypothetical protein Q4V64_52775 [Kutzneria buriramensis]GCB44375.1 hypothetical protein SNL152K_1664 [Streptomyces sp. NL15-2K]
MHRAHLHASLLERSEPAGLRLSHRLLRAEESGDRVRLVFEDGTAHEADVVVGADGIHSVHAADRVRHWALHDREPLHRWSTDRLTLLGDAAHPLSHAAPGKILSCCTPTRL